MVGRCLISYRYSGEGWVRSLVHAVLINVPAVRELAVSAGCRRQMLYYRRNNDQERCHADRGEAAAASGYGQTTETLAWEQVRAQLEQAKQYWLATNRGDGSPHVVPVDGLWVDDVWYYGGSPQTVHVQLVRANPHVTMHLPDPWKVVVVQGAVRVSKPPPELAQRLADLANTKYAEYGITFEASSYSAPGALHPRRVIAWSSFPKDATRFTFAE